MDSFGSWALGAGIVSMLTLIVFGFTVALVCFILAAEIAVVLFTPMRNWLGIPEQPPRRSSRRVDVAEQGLEP
jgi:hypothetical protein